MGWLLGAGILLPTVQADTVTATLTGSVASGADGYGNVFTSTGVYTSLAGLPFTLVFTFDTSLGTPMFAYCGNTPVFSQSSGTDTSPTAVLTIGGRPFTIGGGGLGQVSGSWYALQYAAIACSGYSTGAVGYRVSASYHSGGYIGSSSVINLGEGPSVFPASDSNFSSSYAWWSQLPPTRTDSSAARAFLFNIGYSSGNDANTYDVSGLLAPENLVISGPSLFSQETKAQALMYGHLFEQASEGVRLRRQISQRLRLEKA